MKQTRVIVDNNTPKIDVHEDHYRVVVNNDQVEVITVGTQGPVGPKGDTGEIAGEEMAIQFTIITGLEEVFTLMQHTPAPFTIDSAVCQTRGGTVTADVRLNGSSVGGLDSLNITTGETTTNATSNNTVITGDKLEVALTNNNNADMISVCILGTRT